MSEVRDTFDVLGVGEDEYAYASVIAWLLDPHGEHGIGSALLDQLVHFVKALGVDWAPNPADSDEPPIKTRVRLNDENCGLVVQGANNAGIVILVRLFARGEVRGLDRVRGAGLPVIGLGYGPSAFPAAAELSVWRLQAVAHALRQVPEGRFHQLLTELRARITAGRHQGGGAGGGSAAEDFLATQVERLSKTAEVAAGGLGSSLVEGVDVEMLLSGDMSRAYVVQELLGEGGQGAVYRVAIQGEQFFDGFANPIPEAVIKLSHPDYARNLEREIEVYGGTNPSVVRRLDHGTTTAGAPYLIMERLHHLPREILGGMAPGVAVDVFANLLLALKDLHTDEELPRILCDIKPDNILLRMPGACELHEGDYERYLYEGSYEPVFVDLACAQDIPNLEALDGQLPELIGTPIYLPPEAIPTFGEGGIEMGVYSAKVDTYALTLTFYELLTGEKPYAHHARYARASGREHLIELFELKRTDASPISSAAVELAAGEATAEVLELFELGLHSDPEVRPSADALYKVCLRLFGLGDHGKRANPYVYDGPVKLRTMQSRF